jgi:hypothetical protein
MDESTMRTSLPCSRLVAAALFSACASRAAAPAGGLPPHPVDADAVSLQVFSALQRDDIESAMRLFSMRMAAALSSNDLRQLWRQVIDQNGKLQTMSVVRRDRQQGLDVRALALRFERGSAIGRVAVSPSTGEVEGLFLLPAEAASGGAAAR